MENGMERVTPIIQTQKLTLHYGSFEALKGIDMEALPLEDIIKQALKKMVKQ